MPWNINNQSDIFIHLFIFFILFFFLPLPRKNIFSVLIFFSIEFSLGLYSSV